MSGVTRFFCFGFAVFPELMAGNAKRTFSFAAE